MKILEVLNEFYGDFEFIKEKWNEKKDILQPFRKKTQEIRTFHILMKI